MMENENAPAIEQGAQSNLSKDTNFMENTQLLEAIEVTIPDNAKLNSTVNLPTWGISHLEYYIDHISQIYNCPREYVISGIMVSISSAIGKNIKSFDGKYYNYPLLWMMIVGQQGTNKTEPIRQVINPLYNIDTINYEKSILKESGKVEQQRKRDYEQIIFGNITPEARNELLSKNRGLLRYVDEIVIIEEQKDRYTKNGETQEELSIFSNTPIYINRKGEDPLLIKDPFINQMGTIQPEVLIKSFGKELYTNNGYLARWLFTVSDNEVIPMYNESILDQKIVARYNDFIYTIAKSLDVGTISYSEGAKKLYIEYYNSLQRKKMKTDDSYERGIYSKLQIIVQRWTLTVYTAKRFELGKEVKDISKEIMQYSIECMQYFEYTAMKVWNMILRNRNQQPPMLKMANGELLHELGKRYPKAIVNYKDIAKALEVDRSYIHRMFNK